VKSMEHEVWLNADQETVFEALTTEQGLDGWWGKALAAEPRVGAVVEFDHGLGHPLRMEITDLVPNRSVSWKCVSRFSDPTNPASEWFGQTFHFELMPRAEIELLGATQNATVLRLRVEGWPAEPRWYAFCNSAWGQTLNVRLKDHCEAVASHSE